MNEFKQIYLYRNKEERIKFSFLNLSKDTRTNRIFYKDVLFTVVIGSYNVENNIHILKESLIRFHNELIKSYTMGKGSAILVDNKFSKIKLLTIKIDIVDNYALILGKYQAEYENKTAILFQAVISKEMVKHIIGGLERIVTVVGHTK